MERSEAINELRYMLPKEITSSISRKKHEAVYMAIEALSEPQITRCKDCERRTTTYINGQLHDFCAFYHIVLVHKDESYCSWVERKQDGTE